MFRHIVLFRVHDEVTDDEVAEAVRALRDLGLELQAASWRVELSRDVRKGRIIVEDAAFVDESDFRRFREHSAHIAVAQRMADISDWWVGDYDAS